MPRHTISSPEIFDIRQSLLEDVSSLKGRWRVVDNGKTLETDAPLSEYTDEERAVFEFAIGRPMPENMFGELDSEEQDLARNAPFHALIECDLLLTELLGTNRVNGPIGDATARVRKRVRAALHYLRAHSLHEYIEPSERDPRD